MPEGASAGRKTPEKLSIAAGPGGGIYEERKKGTYKRISLYQLCGSLSGGVLFLCFLTELFSSGAGRFIGNVADGIGGWCSVSCQKNTG